MDRVRAVCRDLGTSFGEFIRFATMQSVGEYEGYVRDDALRRRYYESQFNARARMTGDGHGVQR